MKGFIRLLRIGLVVARELYIKQNDNSINLKRRFAYLSRHVKSDMSHQIQKMKFRFKNY